MVSTTEESIIEVIIIHRKKQNGLVVKNDVDPWLCIFVSCVCVCQEEEQQWQSRVEKLTFSQQKTLQDRLERLKMFRVSAMRTPDFSMQCLHKHTHMHTAASACCWFPINSSEMQHLWLLNHIWLFEWRRLRRLAFQSAFAAQKLRRSFSGQFQQLKVGHCSDIVEVECHCQINRRFNLFIGFESVLPRFKAMIASCFVWHQSRPESPVSQIPRVSGKSKMMPLFFPLSVCVFVKRWCRIFGFELGTGLAGLFWSCDAVSLKWCSIFGS